MFFNNFISSDYEFNECTSRGACSVSPDITSLQEVILIFLRQLAFYELKLSSMDVQQFKNKDVLIEGVMSLENTKEYTQDQLLEIISGLYSDLVKTRRLYTKTCNERDIKCEDLKFALKLSPQMTLAAIIKEGEKAFLEKYKKISPAQKNITEILILVIKSVCANLIVLQSYAPIENSSYITVLKGLNLLNQTRVSLDKIKKMIDELAKTDLELISLRNKLQIKTYGKVSQKSVSLSTRPGKAILVSGRNFQNLYDILEATKHASIDIYSHSDLLIAHSFEAFNKFNHFKGHYGNCMENCVLDFATFPGAILLTKNSAQNLEYLYRGRLFSAEKLPPKGVVQIKDNDFTPLIESANDAKGFAKGREMGQIEVGYNYDVLMAEIEKISEKFKSGEIEHIFFIGMSNYSAAQNEYFTKLLKLLPKKTFVISFSYHNDADNILYINLVNNLPLAYNLLHEISEKLPLDDERVTFFLTKCDANSVSNMISLKNLGAKNIYLSKCPPMVISPTILSTLSTLYNIKNTTYPVNDLENILNNKETGI